jgi:DNA polymerase-4
VEPLSLDEAMLDLTGCERVHGVRDEDWSGFALELRGRIRRETGLWASAGMGETRRIAKIASDLRKPRGLAIIERGAGAAFLATLPVGRLWGVGPRLRERLKMYGYHTAGDIAAVPHAELRARLGKAGDSLHQLVHAKETGQVDPDRPHKSISHETTFSTDRTGSDALEPVLLRLSEKVTHRLRVDGLHGKAVQLKIRDGGFHTFTRRRTLARPTDHAETVYETARRLLRDLRWEEVPVRLIGVGVAELSVANARQGDLFQVEADRERDSLDRVFDAVHERFGEEAIGHGRALLAGRSETPWAAAKDRPAPDSPRRK